LQTITIKRGDNLWRLSRTWYGKGVRWSTLYTANKDQIRNPRWIYPGQVFMVPAGDATWKN
jgi:nucleoid-associated protein YgaU